MTGATPLPSVVQRAVAGARVGVALGVALGAEALAIGVLNDGAVPVGRGIAVPGWWLALGQALGWTAAAAAARALRVEARSRAGRAAMGWAAFLPVGLGFMIPISSARGGGVAEMVAGTAVVALLGAAFAAGRPPSAA